jgi:hypothetical protein
VSTIPTSHAIVRPARRRVFVAAILAVAGHRASAMRRLAVVLVAVAATMTVLAGSAGAVVYGTPDGNMHPHVGIVRFWDANGNYLRRCSGTMLSPTVMLTAGHCTSGTAVARVWGSTV